MDVLTQDSLERAAWAAGIDAPVFFRDQTGSTNTDAIGMAERGVPEWSVFVAGHQVAGRGRLGRTWEAKPGSSLLVSVVFRPTVAPEEAAVLSLLAASAMAEACDSAAAVTVRTKWPNDLLVGERKVGGVLTEAKVGAAGIEHVVVGVGVNVSQQEEDFPEDLRDAATSVALSGGRVDRTALLSAYLKGLVERYRPGEDGWAASVVDEARRRSATIGREVRATTLDGRTVEGTAEDLDQRGNLVVRTEAGPETIAFGQLAHLR